MSNPRAKAAILVRKPKNNAIGPRNSVSIAKTAKTAGIPILSVKNAIDDTKPEPPNQPRTFWAPCGNITTDSNKRKMSGATDPDFLKQTKRELIHKTFE